MHIREMNMEKSKQTYFEEPIITIGWIGNAQQFIKLLLTYCFYAFFSPLFACDPNYPLEIFYRAALTHCIVEFYSQ